jgi:signal transduction histidine kinase
MVDTAGHHDLGLVLVALLVCAAGNWTCMALVGRARQGTRRLQAVWISAAAIVFGSSVWATHFVAMLAMRMPFPASYDLALTALSIAIAVAMSLPGFAAMVLDRRPLFAGAILAVAIGAMHYLGMAALEGPFRLAWDWPLVALSFAAGALAAMGAMTAKDRLPAPWGRITAALALTLAVVGLHYAGVSAVRFIPDPGSTAVGTNFPPAALALMVTAIALLIVFIALTSAYVDRYLEERRNDESARLKLHIAELEETRRELDMALESAQAASRTKSAFLANMSHELRTPLNAIIGFSELLVGEAFGPLGHQRYRSYATDIRTSGGHLLSLINDILDISRLEEGKAELNERPIDLDQLLRETRTMVENHARSAAVLLSVDIRADLPLLLGDERRIKQILLNLLSNAIKFTPPGGKVALKAMLAKDGGVIMTVEDTGIGISETDLPKAFESFGQIDNRLSRKYEGSGLGLPLARHLAELHGGSLTIESEVDSGTLATLYLPPTRSIGAPNNGDRLTA